MKQLKEYFLSWKCGMMIIFIGFFIFVFSLENSEINPNFAVTPIIAFSIWLYVKILSIILNNTSFKKGINYLNGLVNK